MRRDAGSRLLDRATRLHLARRHRIDWYGGLLALARLVWLLGRGLGLLAAGVALLALVLVGVAGGRRRGSRGL